MKQLRAIFLPVLTILGFVLASAVAAKPVLDISAGLSANNDVVWVCGTAAVPAGATVVGAGATSVAPQYLPTTCHA